MEGLIKEWSIYKTLHHLRPLFLSEYFQSIIISIIIKFGLGPVMDTWLSFGRGGKQTQDLGGVSEEHF